MGNPIFTNIQDNFMTNNSEIKIFPNPTKGKFTILAEDIERVEVINLQGKLIIRCKESEIDLSNKPSGIYFVKVTTGEQTVIRKLIKD
jgi:hypothetical protein